MENQCTTMSEELKERVEVFANDLLNLPVAERIAALSYFMMVLANNGQLPDVGRL